MAPYSYVARGDKVQISYKGKLIKTLSDRAARDFLDEAEAATDEELQMLMQLATGQFKHGNERLASSHPRNRK